MLTVSTAQVDVNWTVALATFLAEQRKVEAVRVDAEHRRLEMATIGQVDLELLQAHLAETLERVGSAEGSPSLAGLQLKNGEDGSLSLQKPTCPTAPMLWRWREWQVVTTEAEAEDDWRVLAGLAAACAIFGVAGWTVTQFMAAPAWLPIGFFVIAMIAGGWDAMGDVKEGLPKGELDIHFLMLAVAVGASAIGAWAEGALLLFLFSFSAALEAFAMHRTRSEIDSLLDAAPKVATVLNSDGTEREIAVEAVRVGDHLRVKPGAQFPVDAELVEGKTAADESNLTGEANPVSKLPGDSVYSGTINLWGSVEVRAVRRAGESSLQKVIRLIQEAQHLKAPSQRFTDRFGTGYTIAILGLTSIMFLVWWLGFGIAAFEQVDGSRSAFYRAMTLLVVASPCALVLSIPSAILAAIAWGAKNGILFRGGAAIEKLAEVDLVALDKTGTLTTGEMVVDSIESFPAGREQEAAELAYSLEAHGSHPIGRAIRQYGKLRGLRQRSIEDFQAMSGHGIQGKEGDALCVLGRRELLEEGPLADWIRAIPEPDPEFTENWIFKGDLIARILLKDQIRTESKQILSALKGYGIRTVMLTGDRRGAATAVGVEIGIQEVRSGLKPEGKVDAIREYSRAGYRVAMVGDGVNDAPSLAAAYVSVGMGARGSDAALEQSEVVLMKDRIDNFLAAVRLSSRAKVIIRQNLAIALGTVVLMAGAAIGGWIPLSVAVFAHEGSTVIVCLNSLRLLFSAGRRIENQT
ncbi:heavy metal translocating P-type ATPase [Coraliomargarita akajimensis]|uniref:Heavy metal translocating P-type ATPase n=1 Tax=Coraliomargarita akajimensis (strain DSM 45221 / IAM 15411 / JCM 23193 / KCTC 12865 / 04OKA010-24) TaxID=583355 RepID=D5EJH5_CORAD|nr:cation-translocating P-type ATPase [Coraliomargarita akajimensis]ADE54574.1 heavy metal translocating P-type ATPase [Coraliomargarita akajimensis DSM 45221]